MRHFVLALAVTLSSALYATPGLAAGGENISIVGLFKDKAVIQVDGQRHVVAVGERTPGGILLVSADSHRAVLEVDGKRRTYSLGRQAGGHFGARDVREVRIWPDPRGLYTTVGSINGQPMNFVVDTGANVVALNAGHARTLGIDFRVEGTRRIARTASGRAPVYHVTLERIKVGDIQLRNIDAVVFEGYDPAVALLGMSFLRRLTIEHDGKAMLLRQYR